MLVFFFEGASEREIKTSKHNCTEKIHTLVKRLPSFYIYNKIRNTLSYATKHDQKSAVFPENRCKFYICFMQEFKRV